MDIVTIHAAKTHLSQLLLRVEAGEEIVLARGREPIAKLVPYHPATSKRRFGALRDVIHVGAEILDPLPDEERAAWE